MFAEELIKLRDGIRRLDLDSHRAIIRGETIPENLPHDITVRCLVSGIRHHEGFAQELRGKSRHPSIERALNARDIMSNRIPAMTGPEHIPYCFWHPDVPNQNTLRQLLRDYPSLLMRYQVARACAAGGYTDLYKELDLLPDVAIAEEARDNLASGKDIHDLVMSAPARYRVMDDYNCSLTEEPKPGAFLNGDTCVRSTLDKRQPVSRVLYPPYFDIAEDWNLGAEGIRLETRPIPDDVASLLYTPLPFNLPTVDKDLLILLAAFTGNIDRYIRLRRPRMVNGEPQCIVRGIYHDTFFAKWCYQQPGFTRFRKFVHARFIMNDDLSWINDNEPVPKSDQPYIIWYPRTASSPTYLELARLVPDMKQISARALIASNDLYSFLDLQPEADHLLFEEICNGTCQDGFDDYIRQRASEETVSEWAEWLELPQDFWDVAPDEHLVSKEMKPWVSRIVRELTLDDVGFENREVFGWKKQDARDIMNYISSFPKKPRDHIGEA